MSDHLISDQTFHKSLKRNYRERNATLHATHSFVNLSGYKVRMGFGLHYGWAIEGAIGSIHKVFLTSKKPIQITLFNG